MYYYIHASIDFKHLHHQRRRLVLAWHVWTELADMTCRALGLCVCECVCYFAILSRPAIHSDSDIVVSRPVSASSSITITGLCKTSSSRKSSHVTIPAQVNQSIIQHRVYCLLRRLPWLRIRSRTTFLLGFLFRRVLYPPLACIATCQFIS